ncbi:MAG: tetratricopeptide repeat protein [Flavobacteriaceae bacterium]
MLTLLFVCSCIISQEVPASFKKTTDSLCKVAPKTYTELNNVLNAFKRDTVLMRYFANTAFAKGYLDGEAFALDQLGTTYRNLSQYAKALMLHQAALGIAQKAENIELMVSSYNMIGVVHRRTSSIRAAMDYNQKALELAETVENPSIGIKRGINVSLNSIGNLYQSLKQYNEAIAYFERSLRLETELDNGLGMAINYQNIGECLEEQGELEKAFDNYRTSLEYNEEINNDMGRVICNNSMAQIYLKKGKMEAAIQLLEPTLTWAQKLGDGFLISPVLMNLGWAQLLQKRYVAAEKNMLEGQRIGEKFNLIDQVARSSHLLSDLYQETGDLKKALFYNKKAVKLDEEILNQSTIAYVNDVLFRYDSQKKSGEIEALAAKNKLITLELRKNRTMLLISAIALALLAGILYILYRQYQLTNEKKLLTLEQSMLRSQMNPHFLFNSLNSIKLYIINNEQKNAVHYLNKFSKLVRKILESSSVKEIALADELETVELYMNIENIRFSNEINFKANIAEDIDPHTVKIPSLILQPFLENALWHGLSSKEGEKIIVLDITKGEREGFIDIAITDNGIGREAADIIKKGKVLQRNSVGIDITKERLSNFSRDYLNSFNLEIIDLYVDGVASGTKILLHIPTV